MPVNINLLPDEVIARGVTPAPLGDLPTAFWAGQDRAQQQQLQNLFSGGIPRDPVTGLLDTRKMAEQLARYQGAPAIPTILQLENFNTPVPPVSFPGAPDSGSGRPPLPPSLGRSGAKLEPSSSEVAGGEPKPAGANLTQASEVPGSFQVDYGPVQTGGTPLTARTVARSRGGDDRDAEVLAANLKIGADDPIPDQLRSQLVSAMRQQPAAVQPQRFAQAPVPQPPTERFAPGAGVPPAPSQALPPGFTIERANALEQAAADQFNYANIAANRGQKELAAGFRASAEKAFDAAKQIKEAIAKAHERESELRQKQGMVLPEAAAKAGVARLEKSQEKAETTAQGIAVTQDLFDQLNSRSGIFSGKWANEKLNWARIAEQLGYPIATDKITDTQTFMSIMGQRVASGVKAFGSGTSITNQDREYVTKMVGGDITLDESSIRRILEITDKLNRGQIQKHNADVDRVIKSQPDARPQLEPFKVDMPPKIQNRTTQPAESAQGKTWTSSKGNTYRINPDGSLAPLRP